MDAETHDECQELARLHLVQDDRCGAVLDAYERRFTCDREPHDGPRHERQGITWVAAS